MSFDPTRPFSPRLLPPSLDTTQPEIQKALLEATRDLAHLKGYSMAMPNPMLLVSPAILQETVASSEIEAIHTTVQEVLQAELFPEPERRQQDIEVLRYRDAMNWAFNSLKKLPISTRIILGIHQRLIVPAGGGFRSLQNQLKDEGSGRVIYTPPVASEISKLIKNWEEFANNDFENIDPLIQCAICHYQFEAIHPFSDGNGRTGRIIMILQLVNAEILHFPILYISGYLNKHKPDYYRSLRSVTEASNWNSYLLFMLKAFSSQARQTKETLFQIMNYYVTTKSLIKERHKKIYSADLVDHLFSQPVTSPTRLAGALNIHYTTASRYLLELRNGEVLTDHRIGKYHFFIHGKLLSMLKV